jgi:hypothetical protein
MVVAGGTRSSPTGSIWAVSITATYAPMKFSALMCSVEVNLLSSIDPEPVVEIPGILGIVAIGTMNAG